ncbi:MAG: acylphosphatase [Desulfobacterota bacterium]|nr:acylphosphatase [Thermodesulfobacteriota bacterium]MDW8002081.1 acylphosphatase [Deltaproteobacteria bacterium]
MKERAHIIVKGIVQGVFFRHNTMKMAQKLKITGWVRNLRDGSVEIVCEGESKDIDELVKWCWIGPPGASVDSVEVKKEEYKGEFNTFEIRY